MTEDNTVSLSVENFGFIETGKIELRQLTILTGESNLGKSWLATLVYALNSFSSGGRYRPSRRLINYQMLQEKNSRMFVKDVEIWIERLESEKTIEFNEDELSVLQSYLNPQAKLLEREINRCFGNTKLSKIIRTRSNQDTIVKFKVQQAGNMSSYASMELDVTKSETKYNVQFPKKVIFSKNESRYSKRIVKHLIGMRNEGATYHRKFLINDLLEVFYRKVLHTTGSIYIPAGRVGLINNFRAIVSSVLHQGADPEDSDMTFRSISGVNTDFLTSLINMPQVENSGVSKSIASRLENNLLKGSIVVKPDSFNIPYFYFQFENESDPIPLNMSSSMVAQLASIVLLLRNSGHRKKLLILEEPEAHLHPSQQVLFVDEICGWIRAGYRVLLTTHSEWFIEAIRNVLAGSGRSPNPLLSPNQVGVWNFQRNSRNTGSVITEAEWDQDFGGFHTGFENTAQMLHNNWVDANKRTI